MNKRRSRAYRVLMSGCRYHAGELSALMLGQRRGSLKALNRNFEELRRRIKRQEKCQPIEYFGTYVRDYKDNEWRRHLHAIWTSPITDWYYLKDTFEKIAGEQSSVFINDQIEHSNKRLSYCLQYQASQKGESVRYAQSRNWIPPGYDQAWKEIRKKEGSCFNSWILDLNNWIDIQRTIKHDMSIQTELTAPRLMIRLRSASDGQVDHNDAALQVVMPARYSASPFVKRAL